MTNADTIIATANNSALSLTDLGGLKKRASTRSSRRLLTSILRADREIELPMSFAQERLWFLEQLGLVGKAYHLPVVLRLEGELDEGALRDSVQELVRRHESLRTHFEEVDGRGVQVIDETGEVVLERVAVAEIEGEARDEQVKRLVQERILQPFDLTCGPLFRATLIQSSAKDHVLLMVMHHIVSDGWSIGVLMRELAKLYASGVEGRDSGLKPLAVQYADYAQWQRGWLTGEVLEEHLKYWRERLSGAPPVLELPSDRVRPVRSSHRGAAVPLPLSEDFSL